MSKYLFDWRFWLFGLLSWAVPFALSIPFFSSSGELLISQPLFKSIMVVIGGASGAVLLVLIFRLHKPGFTAAVTIGLVWMVLNLVLDIFILLPMSGDTLDGWYADIGLRYWMMPVMAAAMGAVANRSL